MKRKLLLVGAMVASALVIVLAGCTVSLQGKPLVGVDPNGTLTYKHPEVLETNEVIVPHL